MIITRLDKLRVQSKMIHIVWYEIYIVCESSSDPQNMQYKPKQHRTRTFESDAIQTKRRDINHK